MRPFHLICDIHGKLTMLDATHELIEANGGPEASIASLNITLIVDLTTMGFWIANS